MANETGVPPDAPGQKFDQGKTDYVSAPITWAVDLGEKLKEKGITKTDLDLLPAEWIVELLVILKHGAKKYAPHNWEKGFEWSRAINAACRHLFGCKEHPGFLGGQLVDDESNGFHLASAAWNLLVVMSFHVRQVGTNDLFVVPGMEKDATVAALKSKAFSGGPLVDTRIPIVSLSPEPVSGRPWYVHTEGPEGLPIVPSSPEPARSFEVGPKPGESVIL